MENPVTRLRATFDAARRSPALLLFAVLWALSAALLALGGGYDLTSALFTFVQLVFVLLTLRLTEPAPVLPAPEARERRMLWMQVVVVLVFVVLTALDGLVFHSVIPSGVPLWGDLRAALVRLGAQLFGQDNYVANPVSYFVLPFALLLLLGARWYELGLGRGHRVWRVTLLWCAIPLAYFAFVLLTAQRTPERVFGLMVSNFMQNGFFEEFLMRGALQSRLRRLLTPAWALVISALVFGVWHIGLGFSTTGGSLPTALAHVIVYQGFTGLAYGVIFERTRNLFAGSAAHISINAFGQLMNG